MDTVTENMDHVDETSQNKDLLLCDEKMIEKSDKDSFVELKIP